MGWASGKLDLFSCVVAHCALLLRVLFLSVPSLRICIVEHLYKAIIGRSDPHAWFFHYLFLGEFFENMLSQMFHELLFLKKNRCER